MELANTGQGSAFDELVRRYRPALLRVAQSRLGRADAAEDAVQEAFLAAFKSGHTYNAKYAFRTWLWTILLNKCRRYATCAARRAEVESSSRYAVTASQDARVSELPATEPGPVGHLLARERGELLEAALMQLSEVQADALRLRFFGGLQFQEIAETMGCSLSTAKNRVRWGLLRLSEMLGPESSHDHQDQPGQADGAAGREDFSPSIFRRAEVRREL